MIQLKPSLEHSSRCPYCDSPLHPKGVLWQGIHVCVECVCANCGKEIVEDLSVGHGADFPYQIDKKEARLFGPAAGEQWLGQPFLRSLRSPNYEHIPMQVRKNHEARNVVILNCIDYLYGHSLLKLLNAERHLREMPGLGLVVIVPKFLAWLVPEGAAEVWTVEITLAKAQHFYLDLDKRIKDECRRFDRIFVSRAVSHPKEFDICRIARVKRHDFSATACRVTFVWREDRTWIGTKVVSEGLNHIGLRKFAAWWQKRKIVGLFRALRKDLPSVKFTVVGLGKTGRLPSWIEDWRTTAFSEEIERRFCEIYSESRLIVGIHGSNMLLPSGIAGLTLDLMPEDRWGNYGQDILYQEDDVRLAAFRYRFVPASTTVSCLARVALSQLVGYESFVRQMVKQGS